MRLRRQSLVLVLVSSLVTACKDSPTEPGVGAPATVVIAGSRNLIGVGDTMLLSALVADAGGRRVADAAVTWRSLAPDVGRVDSAGRVVGYESGTAAIVATVGAAADTVAVVVEVLPRQLELVWSNCCTTGDSTHVSISVSLRPVVRDGRGRVLASTSTPTFAVDDTTIATMPAWSAAAGSASTSARAAGSVTYTVRVGALAAQRRVTYILSPHSLAGIGLSQLGFGTYFGCGLDAGGRATCWGSNSNGQLGRGDAPSPTWKSAAPVVAAPAFAKLVVGAQGACGITAARKLWCWGLSGQPRGSTTPTAILADQEVTDADVGTYNGQTCGRTTDGALWCWGNDAGVPVAPRRVDVPAGVEHIAAGYVYSWTYACGTTAAGRVTCTGQLFAPDSAFRNVPGSYPALTNPVVGNTFGCALDADGRAWCWGSDFMGARGRGFVGTLWEPNATAVATSQRFVALGAGADFACGITSAGAIWCWGKDLVRPLASVAQPTPMRISRDETFRSMIVTDEAVCGVRSDGDLRCLGPVNTPASIAPGA